MSNEAWMGTSDALIFYRIKERGPRNDILEQLALLLKVWKVELMSERATAAHSLQPQSPSPTSCKDGKRDMGEMDGCIQY